MERSARGLSKRPPTSVAAFLTGFAIALNRTIAYPPGHPVLASGIEALASDLEGLTTSTGELAIAVARDRLLAGGGETDPMNPLHRGLAAHLHRQQLGAIRFLRGVQPAELTALLEVLTAGREVVRPGADEGWWTSLPNVIVTPFSAGDLSLAEGESRIETADELWRSIAAAVVDDAGQAGVGVSRAEISRAITHRVRHNEGGSAVAGEMARLAARAAGSREDASQAGQVLSGLLSDLDPDVMATLLDAMGDETSRFMLDAVEGIPVDAILPLLSNAARASDETLSHSMLRLLTKLAAQADRTRAWSMEANDALRDSVRSLVEGWTLDDPNPRDYRELLVRLTRHEADGVAPRSLDDASERLFLIGLETGTDSPAVWTALDRLMEEGNAGIVIDALNHHDLAGVLIEECRSRVLHSAGFAEFLSSDQVSTDAIERIAEWLGPAEAGQSLLVALESADTSATRRRLLSMLERLGSAIGPLLVGRLDGSPWYAKRNMLVLLGTMAERPQGFSALPFLEDPDARVRREALKICVSEPANRLVALRKGMADSSEPVVAAALAALDDDPPASLLPAILGIAEREDLERETRSLAVRAAATTGDTRVRAWLLTHARHRRWLLPPRLATKTEILPAILSALRRHWPDDAEARRLLALAARSNDPELRGVATGGDV
jgi:hypothetical protein